MAEAPLFVTYDLGKGQEWRVKPRYTDLVARAGGAYGCVCEAVDTTRRCRVAIKRLARPFEDGHRAKYCFREVKLLTHLRGDERNSVLELYDVFTPATSAEKMTEVYIVTELADITLQHMLRRPPQEFNAEHVEYFLYRLLVGIRYLHQCGVVHRDLKPDNIAIWGGSEEVAPSLKILDFGLARVSSPGEDTIYTQMRYYRAPEVILRMGSGSSNGRADMWSLGCIMAEFYSRRILFEGRGRRFHDMVQFTKIVSKLGVPPAAFLDRIASEDVRFAVHQSLAQMAPEPMPLAQLAPGASPAALDLLSHLLVYDPMERWSAEQALDHPYFDRFRCEDAEPLEIPTPFSWQDFEPRGASIPEWKGCVFDEVSRAQALIDPEHLLRWHPGGHALVLQAQSSASEPELEPGPGEGPPVAGMET